MGTERRLAEIAGELYGLTPTEFTAARNAEAKLLKDAGERELAGQVQALRKPATAAWVVNLLVREDADEVTQMLEVGEALQRAQADLDGDALRELNRQRRKLIAVMAQKGRALARERGVKVSESVAEQVEATLHAAMIDTDSAAAVRTGMLVEPLSPEGFGSLKAASAMQHTALGAVTSALGSTSSGATKSGGKNAGLRAVPGPSADERRREQLARDREEAQAALDLARAEAHDARGELAAKESVVADLQAACLQVNGEIDELRRRIDELEDRLEQLDEEADRAQDQRDDAAEGVALAESALREAQAALDRLG